VKLYNKYWRIARKLQTEQLQKPDIKQLDFSEKNLFHLNIGERGSTFFLGYYSKEGLRIAFDKYGVYKKLARRGFEKIITDIDTSDPYKHKIAMYNKEKKKENLVLELVVRKHYLSPHMPFESRINNKSFLGLAIDWLLIQNILGSFTDKRPRLPGQKYPGLGFSHIVLELILITCWRLNLAAVVNVPEHYHNAFLYSRAFYYLDPVLQAKFAALKKQFKKYPLDKISWGIDWGCVIDLSSNKSFEWLTAKQVVPLDRELKELLQGRSYRDFVNQHMKDYEFKFDDDKYIECKRKSSNKKMEKYI
jgi:hypothetical protein